MMASYLPAYIIKIIEREIISAKTLNKWNKTQSYFKVLWIRIRNNFKCQ